MGKIHTLSDKKRRCQMLKGHENGVRWSMIDTLLEMPVSYLESYFIRFFLTDVNRKGAFNKNINKYNLNINFN